MAEFTIVERRYCTLTHIWRYKVEAETEEEAVHKVMYGQLDPYACTEDEGEDTEVEYEVEIDDEE